MRMWALITDSLREIYARKVIIGIVIIEIVALSITALILFSDGMQDEYAESRMAASPDAAPLDAGDGSFIESDGERLEEDSLLQEFDTATVDHGVRTHDTAGALAADSAAEDRSRSAALESVAPKTTGGRPIDGEIVVREVVKSQLGAFAIPTLIATLFLGIFATAGIVPSMMEKGTIDLLLSKPLPRWKLLWGRAAGGALAVGVNLLFFTVALWALYGTATGVWYAPFIWLTWSLAFSTFLILFTGVIALNVTTDSWVLPMSLAYIHLVILSNFLSVREETIFQWVDTPIVHGLVTALYYALPQTNDIANMTGTAVHTGYVSDWSPLVQGAVFAVVMIAFSTWRFEKRDF